jgi:adenosine deaminase
MHDLRRLPKAHLHLHLSAALRPPLWRDVLDGEVFPDLEPGDGSFTTFLERMATLNGVLRTPDQYARVIHKMADDAAAEGVVWLEPTASLMRAGRLGLDMESMLQLVLDAARQAERDTGVGIGFIVTANRTHSPEEAVDMARLAAEYRDRGVVSFGLADDEVRGAAGDFKEAFAIAREAGLISAPHAGEHAGAESVRAALDVLGAQRIQHGIRCIEDSELVKRLASEQICLDVCPTSNVQLAVVRSLAEHPLPRLLEAGVPVSLNADCPAVFGCGILDEYELARTVFGLDDSTLARIAEASVRASGAPEPLRSDALARIQAWAE